MCIEIYVFIYFCLNKRQNKKQKKKTRKQKEAKETKEEKRISVLNLTWYDDIVCEYTLGTFNLHPGCSCEFNVAYVQGEKS